ncbi:hypothetical protein CEXT_272961 [Caerostris extrusa]|uniref:Uncharacterized protein n=1 Tax=Caerostris extrusa TaxID=172846 RepID=A0AAV4U9F6_CAEEX|nr:hypothetical protein CEXT_272961 [Caerostris extrusa]
MSRHQHESWVEHQSLWKPVSKLTINGRNCRIMNSTSKRFHWLVRANCAKRPPAKISLKKLPVLLLMQTPCQGDVLLGPRFEIPACAFPRHFGQP